MTKNGDEIKCKTTQNGFWPKIDNELNLKMIERSAQKEYNLTLEMTWLMNQSGVDNN